MHVVQTVFRDAAPQARDFSLLQSCSLQLLLVFGVGTWSKMLMQPMADGFSQAVLLGCSTAGEIFNLGVTGGSCAVIAIHFNVTDLHQASTTPSSMEDSYAVGMRLAMQLPAPGLRAVMVLGQSLNINGSALIAGLSQVLPPSVLIFGGLAGDDAAFMETWVLDNSGVHNNHVACVVLYGEALALAHGTRGGWQPFGLTHKVTRRMNNVLFELDAKPTLDVCRRYLGEHAANLPTSGLLFPFDMLASDQSEDGLIRTGYGLQVAQSDHDEYPPHRATPSRLKVKHLHHA